MVRVSTPGAISTRSEGDHAYGGQRLVDLGIARGSKPQMLLMDVPLAGLAAVERKEPRTWRPASRARSWCRSSNTTSAVADRVVALERGAVFHTGAAEPLLSDLNDRRKMLWQGVAHARTVEATHRA